MRSRVRSIALSVLLLFAGVAAPAHAQQTPSIVVEKAPDALRFACPAANELRRSGTAVDLREVDPNKALAAFCVGDVHLLIASMGHETQPRTSLCPSPGIAVAGLQLGRGEEGTVWVYGNQILLRDGHIGPQVNRVIDALRITARRLGAQTGTSDGPPAGAQAPRGDLQASNSVIDKGQGSTLTWRSDGASVVAVTPGVLTSSCEPLNGSAPVGPLEMTTTYTLTLWGFGEKFVKPVTVKVRPNGRLWTDGNPPFAPGEEFVLHWESTNADSAEINGAQVAPPSEGSVRRSLSVTTTYTLTLKGSDEIVTAPPLTVTVESPPSPPVVEPPPTGPVVVPPPPSPVGTLSLRETIDEGESTTLHWESAGATSISVTDGVNEVPGTNDASGNVTVMPLTDTTYTLWLNGKVVAAKTIKVIPPWPPWLIPLIVVAAVAAAGWVFLRPRPKPPNGPRETKTPDKPKDPEKPPAVLFDAVLSDDSPSPSHSIDAPPGFELELRFDLVADEAPSISCDDAPDNNSDGSDKS